MSSIDFYFDFLSPYSYLANSQLPALAAKYGYQINYKPIDLKAAKLAAGNTGPATVQMPAKLRFAMADLKSWADRYGIPLAFAQVPPVSARANKGIFYALQRKQAREYVDALWTATFGSGGEFDSDDLLSGVARELGWNADEFMAYLDSEEAKRLFEDANLEAQAKGVFGAPTFMVDENMWWGNDRLDFLEAYLVAHPGHQAS